MKLVYIASPLRGDYGKNIKNAAEYCQRACGMGVIAFAPHLYFTQFYNDTIPKQREKGLEMGLAMLEKCDELWVMGTHISAGMRGEIARARELDKPIYMVEQPKEEAYYPVSTDGKQLLSGHSCLAGSTGMDYTGQVLVMKYDMLKPEYRNCPNQLWRAEGGFGCSPSARGRRVYVTSLYDGECASFYRQDFAGIVKPEVLEEVQSQYGVFTQEQETGTYRETEGVEP